MPLWLSIPDTFSGALLFAITSPPAQPGQVVTDWSSVPIDTQTSVAGYYNFDLLLPIVPAGFVGSLQLALKNLGLARMINPASVKTL